jgi:hypothetical protein
MTDHLAEEFAQNLLVAHHIELLSAIADEYVAREEKRREERNGEPECYPAWRGFVRPVIEDLMFSATAAAEELEAKEGETVEELHARRMVHIMTWIADFARDCFSMGQMHPEYEHFQHDCGLMLRAMIDMELGPDSEGPDD